MRDGETLAWLLAFLLCGGFSLRMAFGGLEGGVFWLSSIVAILILTFLLVRGDTLTSFEQVYWGISFLIITYMLYGLFIASGPSGLLPYVGLLLGVFPILLLGGLLRLGVYLSYRIMEQKDSTVISSDDSEKNSETKL